VWGGGLYESDSFYQLADSLGIMIWQDFMFACALYPSNIEFIENVAAEAIYQVNRLRHHPSIVVWAANNENEAALSTDWFDTKQDEPMYANDYRMLYIDTLMRIVNEFDGGEASRPFLASSPTNGKESQSEHWLAKNPYDMRYGDLHFYDYKMNGWIPDLFPIPRFMSEFGVQSMPSLATLREVYSIPDDAYMFGSLNQHRQHHGNGNQEIMDEINKNLNLPNLNDSVKNFEAIIYLSQINQAMTLRTGIEVCRRNKNRIVNQSLGIGYCMGSMYWQFNDLWQGKI
jgi:beta-mannosidase